MWSPTVCRVKLSLHIASDTHLQRLSCYVHCHCIVIRPLTCSLMLLRNKVDAGDDMRLALTNPSPGISRLAVHMQAQSSHWLAYVLFVRVYLPCEMIVFLIWLIIIWTSLQVMAGAERLCNISNRVTRSKRLGTTVGVVLVVCWFL